MKKVWIILIVVMTISLAGCGTSVVPGSSVLETAAPSENSTVSQAETTAMPTGAGTVAESIAENEIPMMMKGIINGMRQMWQPLR